jgi:hypothetical protein
MGILKTCTWKGITRENKCIEWISAITCSCTCTREVVGWEQTAGTGSSASWAIKVWEPKNCFIKLARKWKVAMVELKEFYTVGGSRLGAQIAWARIKGKG